KLVTKDDPRVTPVGRFIRKTSLDELPQLINVVFKGNLSLVGPRPHAVHAKAADRLYDDAVDGYFARHRVKPGITGWAQISGWRGETDTYEKIQRRVEHDLYYIENWSVLFDLFILAKTPFALARTENAFGRFCWNGASHNADPRSVTLRCRMTDTAVHRRSSAMPRISVESLGGAMLWLTGFASAFVFVEPSPYEYMAIATMLVFAMSGLALAAPIVPLVLLLVLINICYASAVVPVG